MSHALVNSVMGFAAARFALGLGEAGNFPAAIKTVAEWFPRKERALATGIFNSGSNVGAIVAPLTRRFVRRVRTHGDAKSHARSHTRRTRQLFRVERSARRRGVPRRRSTAAST